MFSDICILSMFIISLTYLFYFISDLNWFLSLSVVNEVGKLFGQERLSDTKAVEHFN